MARYGRSDFTDVRPNTGFVILGWLAGTDFSERISITNNCGEDTDSSTASLGALLGILDPGSIDSRWLEPIGRDLVLNSEITGIHPPSTIDGFTDLVIDLAKRLPAVPPVAKRASFDAAKYAVPVQIGWTNTTKGKWTVRDQTELPPIGAPIPPETRPFASSTLAGTWARLPRAEFEDRILLLRLTVDARGREAVRLMFNSTEHYRIWLDGKFLYGAQGSQFQFPAPHMAPVGQFHDFDMAPGQHELTIAVKRPPLGRDVAEWVIALVERPSMLWIENAFRPSNS
jgi:hypothetical protein